MMLASVLECGGNPATRERHRFGGWIGAILACSKRCHRHRSSRRQAYSITFCRSSAITNFHFPDSMKMKGNVR